MIDNDDYYRKLCSIVINDGMAMFGESYERLFMKLYKTPFVVCLGFPLDNNRVTDALSLRREICDGDVFTDISANVLEVLIALSLRCENQIMHDDTVGDRSGAWFWEMLGNMGLLRMNDSCYDDKYVGDILDRFLYHLYTPDDMRGCAFRSDTHPDLASYELWQQLNFHLNDIRR